jgi:hypothetical protein
VHLAWLTDQSSAETGAGRASQDIKRARVEGQRQAKEAEDLQLQLSRLEVGHLANPGPTSCSGTPPIVM